jgi:hypothetical protein
MSSSELFVLGIQRLSDVRFSHATNSVSALTGAISSRTINFVEADVRLDDSGEAIMAHPPERRSDLTFRAFVRAFSEFAAVGGVRGVKIDFKDEAAIEPCLRILAAAVGDPSWRHPIWLNADVFTGPGGVAPLIDAADFIRRCTDALPAAALSLGWTTGWSVWACVGLHGYTTSHVDVALASLTKLERSVGGVTWAVRASIAMQTEPKTLQRLTQNGQTITVWGEAGSAELTWLRSAEIAPVAFVDVGPPGPYIWAMWGGQAVAWLVVSGIIGVAFAAVCLRPRRWHPRSMLLVFGTALLTVRLAAALLR